MRNLLGIAALAGVLAAGLGDAAAQVQEPVKAPVKTASAAENQKELLAEVDALLKLAAELKVSVDKTTKNELSLDVIRKADAIEKKAKAVREKVKQ